MVVKDGKQKLSMMEGAIFDGVVQFRDLWQDIGDEKPNMSHL